MIVEHRLALGTAVCRKLRQRNGGDFTASIHVSPTFMKEVLWPWLLARGLWDAECKLLRIESVTALFPVVTRAKCYHHFPDGSCSEVHVTYNYPFSLQKKRSSLVATFYTQHFSAYGIASYLGFSDDPADVRYERQITLAPQDVVVGHEEAKDVD